MTDKRWLSVVETAHRLDVSVDTVREMVRNGRLVSIRTSPRGRIRISVASLERLEAGR